MIFATLISYIIISVIRFFSKRNATLGKRCEIYIETDFGSTCTTALFDTGNSLSDSVGGNSVIIIEKSVARKVLADIPTIENFTQNKNYIGFRLLPYSSIGGKGLITAFKPKKVFVKTNGVKKEIFNTLIGICNEPLGDDYKAIINPDTVI